MQNTESEPFIHTGGGNWMMRVGYKAYALKKYVHLVCHMPDTPSIKTLFLTNFFF